jgi:hypothetical protein
MKFVRVLAFALIGLLAIAACSDTPDSVGDAVSSLPESDDVAAAAAEVQTEMTQIADEIQRSAAAEDLESSWNDVQTSMTAAITAATTDGSVDTAAVQAELDDFQSDLEAVGDDVSSDLMSAWTSLRGKFEQLIG